MVKTVSSIPEPLYVGYEKSVQHERIIPQTNSTHLELLARADTTQPRYTIGMRTQGARNTLLEQALVCLMAQEFQSFEVVILAHDCDKNAIDKLIELLKSFPDNFLAKCSIIDVQGGSRGTPLNVAINQGVGEYICFLDDDDLVFAHWLSEFERVAQENPGKIIRSRCVDRYVENVGNDRIPSYVESNLEDTRSRNFHLTQHFFISQTVLHSYVVPRQAIIEAASYVDEMLSVVEDWDFLLRNAELWGVVDTGAITAIYNRWINSGSSLHLYESDIWSELHKKIFQRFNKRGILLESGELEYLYRIWLENEKLRDMAAFLLKDGDALMKRKKENSISRTIQYEQYMSTRTEQVSKRKAVQMMIRAFVPQRLLVKLVMILKKMRG